MAGKPFGGMKGKPFGIKETRADKAEDKKAGIKPGSKRDNAMDRKGK